MSPPMAGEKAPVDVDISAAETPARPARRCAEGAWLHRRLTYTAPHAGQIAGSRGALGGDDGRRRDRLAS